MYSNKSNINSIALAKTTSRKRSYVIGLGLLLALLMLVVSFFVARPLSANAEVTTTPTSVVVGELWNAEEERYFGGIGHKEEVICGCYGDALKIEDIYASAPCDINPIIDYPGHWPMISGWIIQLPEENFNRDYPDIVDGLHDEW